MNSVEPTISVDAALGPQAPQWGVLLGSCTSVLTLLVPVYALSALELEGRDRFTLLMEVLPRPLATLINRLFSMFVHSVHTTIQKERAG
jgi:hypothetical protein